MARRLDVASANIFSLANDYKAASALRIETVGKALAVQWLHVARRNPSHSEEAVYWLAYASERGKDLLQPDAALPSHPIPIPIPIPIPSSLSFRGEYHGMWQTAPHLVADTKLVKQAQVLPS